MQLKLGVLPQSNFWVCCNFIHHMSGKHPGKLVEISLYCVVQLINLLN